MTMCAGLRTSPSAPDDRTSRSPGRMRAFVVHPRPDTVVVRVTGDVDAATSGELAKLALPALATAATAVMDLGDVDFLSVDGLELLAQARKRAASLDTDLFLVVDSTPVRRALEVSGLTPRFQITSSTSEALELPVGHEAPVAAALSVL